MIRIKTVLVLGAGASAPYNYPTGLALKQRIVKDHSGGRPDKTKQILQITKDDGKNLKNFIEALHTSGRGSIDSFLEHRSEFIDMGKIAITQILSDNESIMDMFRIEDWYQYLSAALNSKLEDFDKNQLSIITFNYDRSIDQFLFQSLKSSYNLSDSVAAEKLKAIPIVHVYGQIGYLPWQFSGKGREYYPIGDDLALLEQSSKGIKIISEDLAEDDPSFKQARKLLLEGEKIIFLGFGYHETNLKRLKIDILDSRSKTIIGSALGLTENQRKNIERVTGNKIKVDLPNTEFHAAAEFLRRHVTFE